MRCFNITIWNKARYPGTGLCQRSGGRPRHAEPPVLSIGISSYASAAPIAPQPVRPPRKSGMLPANRAEAAGAPTSPLKAGPKAFARPCAAHLRQRPLADGSTCPQLTMGPGLHMAGLHMPKRTHAPSPCVKPQEPIAPAGSNRPASRLRRRIYTSATACSGASGSPPHTPAESRPPAAPNAPGSGRATPIAQPSAPTAPRAARPAP